MPTLATTTWYYRLFGEEFGPVPHEMLLGLLENGTLSASDEVRAEGESRWVSLQSLLDAPEDQNTATDEQMLETAGRETLERLGESQNGWFCKVLGRELGPLPFEELQSFVEEGQLGADAEVKLGSSGKWRTVRSIGRLMAVLPFQKGEHKIPEGRSSKEFTIPPVVEEAPVEKPRRSEPPRAKSRYADDDDDFEDEDEEDDRRSRRKRRKRRSSDSGQFNRSAPGYGMPPFAPNGGMGGYGFPGGHTPGYGMPAMAGGAVGMGGYGGQWAPPVAPAPVDHHWYAWINGQEYGPSEYSQLTQWAVAGQLSSTDYVKQGSSGQYVLASTVSGLIPATPAPAAKPAVTLPPVPVEAVVAPSSTVVSQSATKKVDEKPASSQPNASDTAKLSRSETSEIKTVSSQVSASSAVEKEIVEEAAKPAYSSASSSSSGSYGSSGGYGSSGFGGAAARPMPPRPLPKKKASMERPEWVDDAIGHIKSPTGLAAAGLMLLMGLYFAWGFLPASTGSDRALQTKLETILTKVKTLRTSKAPASEWDALAQQATAEFPPAFVDQLKQTASRKYPYKQLHLWCIRDRLQKMLTNSRTKISHEEHDFENNLREAAKLLKMPTTIVAAPEVAATAGGAVSASKGQ